MSALLAPLLAKNTQVRLQIPPEGTAAQTCSWSPAH